MAALRHTTRKLLLQRTQASYIVFPAIQRRLVPRLVHTCPPACSPASAAPKSDTARILKIQGELKKTKPMAAPLYGARNLGASALRRTQVVVQEETRQILPRPIRNQHRSMSSVASDPPPPKVGPYDITDPNDVDAAVECLQLIKAKTEELYDLSSGIERHVTGRGYHARFNQELLRHLSSLVDPRHDDIVWRRMKARSYLKILKYVACLAWCYLLMAPSNKEGKGIQKQEKIALGSVDEDEEPNDDTD